ncbi:tight adherence protein C [Arcanobacterium wilhelmae]|uniref:Tight adherence protein C n=1 Tax=Arcanobacterium wilhelmae TaxID=1803177 RepID=A0ABT9NAY4_9ACTO|nr:type II secretion system F family protein [Arcanobacterium wilhelmae]MDP9800887.1 tight adherence protein C [Arcanobacterium wilhelmae]WFN90254.1 type II secretion system F family protein [Arcanobacterium wilhelmae]
MLSNDLFPLVIGLGAACVVVFTLIGVRLWVVQPLTTTALELSIEGDELANSLKPKESFLIRIGRPFVAYLRRLLPYSAIAAIQRKIDLAGRPKDVSVDSVLTTYAGLGILSLPLATMYLLQGSYLLAALLVALVGVLPMMRLTTAARKRREMINRDLPDFMDVLAVTVSSGVGFRAALATVATRFGGPLAEELAMTLDHINNGFSLRVAFSAMRARTDSEAVNEFVSAYIQAEELGIPLGATLRQIASDMRDASAQRNLQRAHKMTPKITLISTAILVPAVIILIVVGMFLGMDIDFGNLFGK